MAAKAISQTCWHGGVNHKAANCWKGNHVRQVCDEQDTPHQQHQQQQSIPPSQSSQSQHVSNPAAPSSASATTYRVNRVSTYNDAQELVFDLCGSDVDFSDIRICALKTSNLSSCCVETFCIANESDSDECKSNDFPSDCSHASLEDISRLYSDDTDWVATYGVTSAWLDGCEMVQSSYVCLRDDRTWKPQPIPVACQSPFASCFIDQNSIQHPLRVCTMTLEDQGVEVLIDSGPDATVIPLAFAGCGRSLDGNSSLVDCQGNHLHTSELREFAFVMRTTCGKTVRSREVGHVSSAVSCPIISYGKQFNAVRVQVPQRWQQLAKGWYFTATDLPMCRSAGECFIDPSEHFSVDDYPFRTTIEIRWMGNC